MSRDQIMSITWPSLCIGCGTDRGLVRHEYIPVKLDKLTTLTQQEPLAKQAQFYICEKCSGVVQSELKKAKGYFKSSFLLSFLLGLIGSIIALVISETFWIFSIFYSMMILSLFPLKFLMNFLSIRRYSPTRRYYRNRFFIDVHRWSISFRCSEFVTEFSECNPDIPVYRWTDSPISLEKRQFSNYPSICSFFIFCLLASMVYFNRFGGFYGAVFHIMWTCLILITMRYYRRETFVEIMKSIGW